MRGGFNCVIENAHFIGEAVLDSLLAGERKARRKRTSRIEAHGAPLSHIFDEDFIRHIDELLIVGAFLIGEGARAVTRILRFRRCDIVDTDAQLVEQLRKIGHLHHCANGADVGGLVHINQVGLA